MRPRVFPAEDASFHANGDLFFYIASMRPRVFPAEDQHQDGAAVRAEGVASMRPRVFPAEDYYHACPDPMIDRLLQ